MSYPWELPERGLRIGDAFRDVYKVSSSERSVVAVVILRLVVLVRLFVRRILWHNAIPIGTVWCKHAKVPKKWQTGWWNQ